MQLKIGFMPKFKIHPAFLVLGAILALTGKFAEALASISAVLLHEAAHAVASGARGYQTGKITLLPYGAALNVSDDVDDTSLVIIAAAGPAANFLTCLLTVSVWWIFPATYVLTKPFYTANLTIGLFNLLPAYPLDGARIVLGMSKRPHRALKRLKVVGIAISAVLTAVFIVLAANKNVNLTLGIMGVFLFVGAVKGQNKETASLLLKSNPLAKNFVGGVKEETYHLSSDATLRRAVLLTNSEKITKIVVEGGGKSTVLTEAELFAELKRHKLGDSLADVISARQNDLHS